MKKIDLSHTIKNQMPAFTDAEKPVLKTYKDHQVTLTSISSSLHVGTHIDAPMHMQKGTFTLDTYPLDRFYGRAIVFDVQHQNPINHLEMHALIQPGDIVILKTGHSHCFYDESYYQTYPVISETLAGMLIDKKIKMIGLDTPSPDKAPFVIHHKFMTSDILIIENLTNLDEVPCHTPIYIDAFPLKIEAEAALTRVIATINESS